MLVNFRQPDPLSSIVLGSDQEIGGYSTSELDIIKPASVQAENVSSNSNSKTDVVPSTSQSNDNHAFGRFHGNLSLDLPRNRPDVVRSGYAMFRTKELYPSLFGIFTECWDWKACSHMMLRVRGDRRKYFINVQAESALKADIYQHRLFLKTPGQWETIIVPLSSFILTNWGIIQQQLPMNRDQVRTVGIGLTDRQYGPFNLDIDWIKVVDENHIKALISGIDVENRNKVLATPGKRLSIDDFK